MMQVTGGGKSATQELCRDGVSDRPDTGDRGQVVDAARNRVHGAESGRGAAPASYSDDERAWPGSTVYSGADGQLPQVDGTRPGGVGNVILLEAANKQLVTPSF